MLIYPFDVIPLKSMCEPYKPTGDGDRSSPLSSLLLSPSLLFPAEKCTVSLSFVPLQRVTVANFRTRQRALADHSSLSSAYRAAGLSHSHSRKLLRFAELLPVPGLPYTGRVSLVGAIHCELMMTEFELGVWFCTAGRFEHSEQLLWFAGLAAKHFCTPECDLVCEAAAGKWRINVEEYRQWRSANETVVTVGEVNAGLETLGRQITTTDIDYNAMVEKMVRPYSEL